MLKSKLRQRARYSTSVGDLNRALVAAAPSFPSMYMKNLSAVAGPSLPAASSSPTFHLYIFKIIMILYYNMWDDIEFFIVEI